MNMNPWKDQTYVINGFDIIRKIEDSVSYEQVGIRCELLCLIMSIKWSYGQRYLRLENMFLF